MQDYYAALGLPPDVEQPEIRRAFRLLVMESHPDRVAGDPAREAEAERRTRALIQAYRTLGNASKRHTYDGERARQRLAAQQEAARGCPLDLLAFTPTGSVRAGKRGIGQFTLRNHTTEPVRVSIQFADRWLRPKQAEFRMNGWRSLIAIFDIEGSECRLPAGLHLRPLTVLADGVPHAMQVAIEVKGSWF